jgi:hypothetical protein
MLESYQCKVATSALNRIDLCFHQCEEVGGLVFIVS